MCHRFTPLSPEDLHQMLLSVEKTGRATVAAATGPDQIKDAWPGSRVTLLVPAGHNPGRFDICDLTWGFDPALGGRTVFNTRIETALEQMGRRQPRGMWGDILRTGRCLVPARGFYEPLCAAAANGPAREEPTRRQRARFTMPGWRAFFMAGVWRDGRFSIVTTAANRHVAPIHDRMPIVLGPGETAAWINGDEHAIAALADRSSLALACSYEQDDRRSGPTVHRGYGRGGAHVASSDL